MSSLEIEASHSLLALRNKKIDRISDLPCNVIDDILGNLKIRYQVRTSILSRKWKYMWTLAPQLCFDEDFFECFRHLDDPNPVISKIITDVLMLHDGLIHKFTLFIPNDDGFHIAMEYLNMWIPILSRKDIKHLDIVNFDTVPDEIPSLVFSCKQLTYFKIGGFNFSIPPNFCSFKKLLELHLYMVIVESAALESLMSGCPFLEKLSIQFGYGFENLDVSSPTLKVLFLYFCNGSIRSLPKIKKFSLVRSKKNSYADVIPHTVLASSSSSLEYLKLDDLNWSDIGDILYVVNVLKSAPRLIELVLRQCHNHDDTTQVSDHSKELECRSCCLKLQTVDIEIEDSPQHAMSLIQFILANSPLLKTLTFNCNSKNLNARKLYRISQDLLWMDRASPRAHVKLLHCAIVHNSLCGEEGVCTADYFFDDES